MSSQNVFPSRVEAQGIVMTTTNGTRALRACAGAGATLVGSFRYGLAMRWQVKSNPRQLLDPAPLNLPAIIAQNQYYKAYPTFNLDSESFPRVGSTKGVNRFYTSTWLATFYKQLGNHSLKFGVDFRLPRYNNLDPGGQRSRNFHVQ